MDLVTSGSGRDEGVPCGPASLPQVHTVFLTGFMGSGKTSIGAALARAMGWRFLDLDSHIEQREQTTIGELFRLRGEAEFRQIERQVLADLLAHSGRVPMVVALGGGTFVQPANFDLFAGSETLTVFLDAPVEELWERCQQDSPVRPLRQDPAHFRNLYQARREFYTKAGVHIQTSGKSVQQVAEEIAARLRRDLTMKEQSR